MIYDKDDKKNEHNHLACHNVINSVEEKNPKLFFYLVS